MRHRGYDRLPVSEADLQQEIIDLAHTFGWKVAHFRPARLADGSWRTPVAADGKGFPDLVLVHPDYGWVIFAETKSINGKVSTEQEDWLKALAVCKGVEVYIWRPTEEDWEEIKSALMPVCRQVKAK